jgi:hypothetical protein
VFAAFSATSAITSFRKLFVVESGRAAATCSRSVITAIILRQFASAARSIVSPIGISIVAGPIPFVTVGRPSVSPVLASFVGHFVRTNHVRMGSPIHVGRELHQTGCRDPAEK